MQLKPPPPLAIPALLVASLCLSGCSFEPPLPNLGTSPAAFHGSVFGGQQPVSGATVTVYAVGSSGYGTGATSMASTTSDSSGNFSFATNAYTCPASNTPMYIVATGSSTSSPANSNLALVAALGNCSTAKSATVNVNEVTTAATVLALGQFMSPTLGSGAEPVQIGGTCYSSGTTLCTAGTYNAGLVHAMNYTYPQLVTNATGTAVGNSTSGSITITTESAKINSIANVLAYCVNSTGETSTTETTTNCGKLFSDVNAKSASPRPYDTIQAALMMDLYPYYNVSTVFGLGQGAGAPFVGLSTTPNDWTVAISFAYPNMSVGINGSSNSRTNMNLDIDTSGRIWFTSTQSGAVGIGYFDPSSTTFNGPYNSTVSPLVHPQYLAIDNVGVAWISDMSNPYVEGFSTSSPSSSPTVLTAPSGGLTTGPITFDNSDNLFVFYTQSGSVSEAEATSSRASLSGQGNLSGAASYLASGINFPIAYTSDTYFTLSGANTVCRLQERTNFDFATTAAPCYSGGISEYVPTDVPGEGVPISPMSNGQFCTGGSCSTPTLALSNPEGIVLDGSDQIWVANSGNGSITTYAAPNASAVAVNQSATVPYLHDSTHGGTLTNPFALGVDGSGNVWTISPGCVTASSTACTPTGMTLTNLVGAAGPTITPIAAQTVHGTVGTRPTQ